MEHQPEPTLVMARQDARVPGPNRWPPATVQEREMRLRDYWEMVRRHGRLVAMTVAAVTVPVAVVSMLSPDYYSAKARIEINMERPDRIADDPADAARAFVSN